MYDYRKQIIGLAEQALKLFVNIRLKDLRIQNTWKTGLKKFVDDNYPRHQANYKKLYVFLQTHSEQEITLEQMDITALATLVHFYGKFKGIYEVALEANQLFINHVMAMRELRNAFDHYPMQLTESDAEKMYFDQLYFSSNIACFAVLMMKYKSPSYEWKRIYHKAKAIESSLYGERWLSIDSLPESILDNEEDLSDLIALSEQGNVEAQIKLGKTYYHGDRIKSDSEKAYIWIRKAALRGNVEAEYYLGLCISNGIGVDFDTQKGLTWTLKAAEKGFAAAQYMIGMYLACTDEKQQQTPEQKQECFKWTKMAADQDYPDAVWLLSALYRNGTGVTKDVVKSDILLNKASQLGCCNATEQLAKRAENAARENGEWEKALDLYLTAKKQNTNNQNAYQSQIRRCEREIKKKNPIDK